MESRFMKSKYILFLLLALILILVLNISVSSIIFRNSEGAGKQINDIGRIRGGIQRIVKLQYAGTAPRDLIRQMDDRIAGLVQVCAQDAANPGRYQKAVLFSNRWNDLKTLLIRYGDDPSQQNGAAMLQASEEIWAIADEAVDASQFIDERNATNMKYTLILVPRTWYLLW